MSGFLIAEEQLGRIYYKYMHFEKVKVLIAKLLNRAVID